MKWFVKKVFLMYNGSSLQVPICWLKMVCFLLDLNWAMTKSVEQTPNVVNRYWRSTKNYLKILLGMHRFKSLLQYLVNVGILHLLVPHILCIKLKKKGTDNTTAMLPSRFAVCRLQKMWRQSRESIYFILLLCFSPRQNNCFLLFKLNDKTFIYMYFTRCLRHTLNFLSNNTIFILSLENINHVNC